MCPRRQRADSGVLFFLNRGDHRRGACVGHGVWRADGVRLSDGEEVARWR
jgi:hypothetical protein